MPPDTAQQSSLHSLKQRTGLLLGLVAMGGMLTMTPSAGMSDSAWRTSAVGLLMVTWWISEAVPIAVTALLPLVLFPLLGIADIGATAAPYANSVIFLFLGGFLIARALQECGLHRRMALLIITIVGSRPTHLVGGFMVATAFISMWVSNTATVVMLYPMALSVVDRVERENAPHAATFALALLLGVGYAASIGGLGTLIGTPPNALLAGFAQKTLGVEIGFAQWMLLGVPLVVVALPISWWMLVRPLRRFRLDGDDSASRAHFREELTALGPLTNAEFTVGGITLLTALAWVLRPLFDNMVPGLSDANIAIGGAILVFAASAFRTRDTLLTWEQAERLPWSVLLLFGGGLTLADAVSNSGLADWIGNAANALAGIPIVALVAVLTVIVLLMSELASNTATAAVFLPVVASMATGMGIDPLLLAIPVALTASCGFMLPIATPPNAIVFASGRITMPQMMRAGVSLNIVMLVLVNIAVWTFGRRVF